MRAMMESVERSVQTYNSLFPKEELERIAKMTQEAAKSIEPVMRMMQDPAFQRHLEEINLAASRVSDIIEKQHALTLPAIQAMEELYGVVDETSTDIAPAYAIPEEIREALVTRPIFSETKLQIRSGIPSVKEILPLKLPDSTTWEHIQVRFVDPRTVFIEIHKLGVKLTVDYNDMGMCDLRSHRPNAQWLIFHGLAQYGGEITWQTPIAGDGVKKQKQLLSTALKRYFGITDDPFGIYREEKAYRLKMALIPDAESPTKKRAPDDDRGVTEYLEDTMTSVYDKYENYENDD